MPIYEYKCHTCGHHEDVLQKMSDTPLTDCPQCGQSTFDKLISRPAGFDLKGNGWYVTDFKTKSTNTPSSGKDSSGKPTTTTDNNSKPQVAPEKGKKPQTD